MEPKQGAKFDGVAVLGEAILGEAVCFVPSAVTREASANIPGRWCHQHKVRYW